MGIWIRKLFCINLQLLWGWLPSESTLKILVLIWDYDPTTGTIWKCTSASNTKQANQNIFLQKEKKKWLSNSDTEHCLKHWLVSNEKYLILNLRIHVSLVGMSILSVLIKVKQSQYLPYNFIYIFDFAFLILILNSCFYISSTKLEPNKSVMKKVFFIFLSKGL